MSDEFKNISWPGWETVKLIGRGSFGAVYEIQRDILGEKEYAALKAITIPQDQNDIEEMYSDGYNEESITETFNEHLKSIVAEYSLMRKMNGSANIVNCDDIRYVQHDDGIGWDIFIKMELLTPLAKALSSEVPEETVVKIAKDMCAALELCKKHEIVHRDIKPQNIFVSPYGDYKLGDFGIAKNVEKTMGGTKIGTYKYMAPEVYNNQPYGSSADIYSLGLVLYWLLNERRMPFLPLPPEKLKAGMEESARNRRLSGEQLPPPAHGSEELKRIVLKACAYDSKDRYASAAEMLEDIKRLEGGVSSVGTTSAAEGIKNQNATEGAQPHRFIAEVPPAPPVSGANPQNTAPNNGYQPISRVIATPETKSPPPPTAQKKKKPWLVAMVASVVAAVLLVIILWPKESPKASSNVPTSPNRTHIGSPVTSTPATCNHKWQSATCTEAERCTLCGKTNGSALGHQWISATESRPKICNRCGERNGVSLGRNLTDCSIIEDSDGGGDIIKGSHKAVNGTWYNNAICFWVNDTEGLANTEHVVYRIAGKYNTLSGTVALGDASDSWGAVEFLFYADGQLLYKTNYISGAKTQTVRMDVTNVQELRIECITYETCNSYGILTATLTAD